jgi:hypothetical protein
LFGLHLHKHIGAWYLEPTLLWATLTVKTDWKASEGIEVFGCYSRHASRRHGGLEDRAVIQLDWAVGKTRDKIYLETGVLIKWQKKKFSRKMFA